MRYTYKDVYEFQKKHPKREKREIVLETMSPEEIQHLIDTCGTVQGKIYYSRFKKEAEQRENEGRPLISFCRPTDDQMLIWIVYT